MTRRTHTKDVSTGAVPQQSLSADEEPFCCGGVKRLEPVPQPCRIANPRKRRLILARIDALLEARRTARNIDLFTRH